MLRPSFRSEMKLLSLLSRASSQSLPSIELISSEAFEYLLPMLSLNCLTLSWPASNLFCSCSFSSSRSKPSLTRANRA